MSAMILSGKVVAKHMLREMKREVARLQPKLVVVQVGDDQASESYIRQKLKSCAEVGMHHEHIHLASSITFDDVLAIIDRLNNDGTVTGFIVQLPLPKHLQSRVPDIIKAIDPNKDVDGFGACSLGNVFLSREFEYMPPATPAGVIQLLEYYKLDVEGKHAVILGRSNIVGKPLAIMLLNRGATVTVCHSKTNNVAELTRQADILCSAVGSPNMVTKEMVKQGAIVIDIGITRNDGKLCGDVDFETVRFIASAITPVPGGVGPLTVASLLANCVRAAQRNAC